MYKIILFLHQSNCFELFPICGRMHHWEMSSTWLALSTTESYDNCNSTESCRCRECWTWDDGTPYDPKVYHAWNGSLPDFGKSYQCVELLQENKWFPRLNSTSCDNAIDYVCEKGENLKKLYSFYFCFILQNTSSELTLQDYYYYYYYGFIEIE